MPSQPKSTDSSVLCIKEPIVQNATPPVIIIGLPRSGSTFLAHVLSCMKGLYVFDDLYPYQGAKALNLKGNLTPDQQKAFLNKLSWSARAKIRFKKNIYAFAPQCTWKDIEALEESILTAFQDKDVTWPILLEEWLTRLSLYHNCSRWGYKTPQDFMNLEELSILFPGAQFVFIMRDPRKVMASFKNLPKKRDKQAPDGVSGQYHPIIYANYWKIAYEQTISFIDSHPKVQVYIIKFEDLVFDPDRESTNLAQFLNTDLNQSVQVERTNSSFSSKSRKDITSTETWLCEVIAGKVMEKAEYPLEKAQPSLLDLLDLINTSTNFCSYQIQRYFSDNRARQSIINYAKSLFNKNSKSISN